MQSPMLDALAGSFCYLQRRGDMSITFKMSLALFRISPGFAACASYANYSANMRLNESWFGCACDYKAMEASMEQASLYFRVIMTVYRDFTASLPTNLSFSLPPFRDTDLRIYKIIIKL